MIWKKKKIPSIRIATLQFNFNEFYENFKVISSYLIQPEASAVSGRYNIVRWLNHTRRQILPL